MGAGMKVSDLVTLLLTLPQDIEVIVPQWSESRLLGPSGVAVVTRRSARTDGWVHDERPDKERQTFLEIG